VIVIEHYPADEGLRMPATFAAVVDDADPRVPNWRRLSADDVEMLVGEPVTMWSAREYTVPVLVEYTVPVLVAAGTTPNGSVNPTWIWIWPTLRDSVGLGEVNGPASLLPGH
jgi:hypothetical protein